MAELDLGKVVMDSYNDLDDKPSINGVELNGELKTSQFGLDQAIEAVNLARLNFKEFNTLEEFVNKTAKENDVPHFSTMWDGGGWGPLKRATHYKYLIAYEGRYNNPEFDGVIRDDVRGSGLFWDNENNIWYVTIQGNVGTLTFSYFKIEPNQIPTNNLLATVAGTPLDAVQGKVLKGQIGDYTLSPSVIDSNTSYGIRTIFGTISNNSGTDSITQHFKDIGFSSTDKTLQELLDLICQGSNRREFIKISLNNNTTIFNQSLPMNSAGILEIYRMESRRCLLRLNYLKGGEYVSSYTDGTLGAWQKLVTETELNKKGTVTNVQLADATPVSVLTSDFSNITEVPLEKGNYLVVITVTIQKNATGNRGFYFGGNSTPTYTTVTVPNSGANNDTRIQYTAVLEIGSKTNYYFVPYQNSGQSLNMTYSSIKIVKL